MARSLNKVSLIGNLTRDPELRYTPQGTAVCTFGLATNRQWTTEGGEKKEDAEFHRIVAWNKLAELCSQLLAKGRKVYVEGRLQTRTWTGADEVQRTTTEIVISDMIILDSRRDAKVAGSSDDFDIPQEAIETPETTTQPGKEEKPKAKAKTVKSVKTSKNSGKSKVDDEDMPF
jgi:single-strand DNA-binding protein